MGKKEQITRVVWIDWAKMVLIYLMVVGHFHPPLVQSQFFYVFHMPAFFIISGYLYHPHDWRRTVVSLMAPVVIFSVFNLLFQMLIAELKQDNFDTSDLLRRTLVPFIGGSPEPNVDYIILFMGAWFPIVLMLIRLFVGDLKCFGFVYKNKKAVFFLVVAFMITLPFWADMKGEICQLKPFLLFPSLPFFLLGSMLHEVDAHKLKMWLYRLLPLFFVLYLLMAIWNGRVGILNLNFGHNYFFFFVGAVSGSALVFGACMLLPNQKFVRTISIGTMLILGLHMVFYDVLFPILNRMGIYSLMPDWGVVWFVAVLTIVFAYWPIGWCMRHMPFCLVNFQYLITYSSFMNIKNVLYKLLGSRYTVLALWWRNVITKLYANFHPYHYDGSRYGDCFLNEETDYPYEDSMKEKLNRVIYVFWTGANEITPNRLQGIQSLEGASGVKVQLITPWNLPEYIVEGDPLPEAYQYLSLNHRSDFLRGYFMYHYGGGYADIKTYYKSWIRAFDRLDRSDSYVIGYPEVGWIGVANRTVTPPVLKRDLSINWSLLIGNGAFICRPHTKFVAEWYTASRRRLISYTEQLRQHPARDAFGTNEDYPLPWESMQGAIFHPFCLKYHDHILKDRALEPSFKDYR